MRLTDNVLRDSDNSIYELVGKSLLLAAAGRFGLIPSTRPFELNLDIDKKIVDIKSLHCLAVTRDGSLIDTCYDTKFTNTFDTRILIPESTDEQEFLITINAESGQWQETNDGFEEPVYTFSLIKPNTPIPPNALPIGRIVNIDNLGWREDDVDFVPPCLFVTSHHKYKELSRQFSDILSAIDAKVRDLQKSDVRAEVRLFWSLIRQVMITMSKECDTMTPMSLLANVQKCVNALICACSWNSYLKLENADELSNYVYASYNYKDAYQKIKEGLDLCFSIKDNIEILSEGSPTKTTTLPAVAAPMISNDDLFQDCSTSESTINITYHTLEANIFFTTDGSEPTSKSKRATKTRAGFKIKFDNGYRQENGKEPDKNMSLKLIAVVDGASSDVSCYRVSFHKNLKFRDAIPI